MVVPQRPGDYINVFQQYDKCAKMGAEQMPVNRGFPLKHFTTYFAILEDILIMHM